jgi:hypothetical protein
MLVESPCVPLVANDDHQAMTGAGIQESSVIDCVWVVRDGNGGSGAECVEPPTKFIDCAVISYILPSPTPVHPMPRTPPHLQNFGLGTSPLVLLCSLHSFLVLILIV